MKRLLAVLAFSLSAGAAQCDATLDEYVRLQVGTFSSEAQARTDSRYDTAIWHITEIWHDDQAAERWLYTESWLKDAPKPYIQRISRLTANADGTLTASRYSLPEAGKFAGAWEDPQRFGALDRGALVPVPGCDLTIVRAGKGRFEGSTLGVQCRNAYKGADYALSRSVLADGEMTNWDRGFKATGEQVWGPAAGGYRFHKVDGDPGCRSPVRMLVFGEITDRAAFGNYAKAIREAGLYERTGGYYEALTPALEVFEGAPPPTRGVVISRFPCLEAARRFWNAPEYREIVKLREGIAKFEVLVLPVPPLPRYVTE